MRLWGTDPGFQFQQPPHRAFEKIKQAIGISQIRKPLGGSFIRFGVGVNNKLRTDRIERHNFRNSRFYFRRAFDKIRRDAVASSLRFGFRQPVSALVITQADGQAIRRRERGTAKINHRSRRIVAIQLFDLKRSDSLALTDPAEGGPPWTDPMLAGALVW